MTGSSLRRTGAASANLSLPGGELLVSGLHRRPGRAARSVQSQKTRCGWSDTAWAQTSAGLYAGVMPERVAAFVNVEGFGLPESDPDNAPAHYRRWLEKSRQDAGVFNLSGY